MFVAYHKEDFFKDFLRQVSILADSKEVEEVCKNRPFERCYGAHVLRAVDELFETDFHTHIDLDELKAKTYLNKSNTQTCQYGSLIYGYKEGIYEVLNDNLLPYNGQNYLKLVHELGTNEALKNIPHEELLKAINEINKRLQ